MKKMFTKEELNKIDYAVEWYIRDGMASKEEYKEVLFKLKTLKIKQKKVDLKKEIQELQKEVQELSDN